MLMAYTFELKEVVRIDFKKQDFSYEPSTRDEL
jgi:hypothetical protein